MNAQNVPLLATLGLTMLGGCAHYVSSQTAGTAVPAAIIADAGPRLARDIPEALLLDVGIAVFASDDAQRERRGHAEVRRAEANFMAYHLKGVLQATGRWGAVRVVPRPSLAIDLGIEASILHSDGSALAFRARATDARGVLWLEKEYRATAAMDAYARSGAAADPFQAAYTALARDLAAHLDTISLDGLAAIRRVAELRFARGLAPDAFAQHLAYTPSGEYELRRLPALDDPMLARVRSIRRREHLFIDTLDEYYRDFSAKMYLPYHNWRRATYEGDIARQQLEQEANARLLLGSASIIAGLATSNDAASSQMRLARIVNGAGLVKGALDKNAAIEIHAERLRELGAAAEAEIAPHTIELENRTHRLQGTVEAQFDNLRRILGDLYRAETGLPANAVATEAQPPPATATALRHDAPGTGPSAAMAARTLEPKLLPPVAGDVYAGLSDAEQHIKAGAATDAIAILRALLDATTTRNGNELAQIHYLLGIAHFIDKDNAQAIQAFEQVVAQGDNAPRELLISTYFNLARLFILARNYAAALRYLQPGMAKSNVVDTACSAVCSAEAKRKAKDRKRRARGSRSGRSAMHQRNYLAIVSARKLLRAEDYDGAIAVLSNALDTTTYTAPGLATVFGLLATAHIGKKNFRGAIDAYEQLLARSEGMSQGHKVGAIYNLAQLHFIEENYEKSLQYQQAWLKQSDIVSDACPTACSATASHGGRDRPARRRARSTAGRSPPSL